MSDTNSKATPDHFHAYRGDIDGLRAIAVCSVVIYHFFPNHLPGGFVGVDIFFVISGFLISQIALSLSEKGQWSYSRFYTRRINRIFPALVLVLLVNMALGWYALVPNEFQSLGKHIAGSAGFIVNFLLWGEAGYFDAAASTKPLLHMWSLAIEEQFYIVWPIVMTTIMGLARRRAFILLACLILISLAFSATLTYRDPDAAYYSPLSRFFELAIGGFLAFLYQNRRDYKIRIYGEILSAIGLLVILASMFLVNDKSPFPGFTALLPVLGTAAVIWAGPNTFTNRWGLSLKPMIWMGLISYPLYLWHWPLLVWGKLIRMSDHLSAKDRLALIALAVALAWLTFLFVERPVRKRNNRRTAIALASVMAVLLALGLSSWLKVLPNRLASPDMDMVVAAVNDWDYPSRDLRIEMKFIDYNFYRKEGHGKRAVLFVGDSYAEQYAPRIVRMVDETPESPSVIFATKGGCKFAIPLLAQAQRDCVGKLEALDQLIQDPAIDTIVFAQDWSTVQGLDSDSPLSASLEARLASVPSGKRIFLILSIPNGEGFGPVDQIQGSRLGELRRVRTDYRSGEDVRIKLSSTNAALRDISRKYDVTVIDPFDSLCGAQGCRLTDSSGRPAYKDRGHLSATFTREAATWVDVTLRQTGADAAIE